jgi:integrase/recombinase XerC
MPPRTAAKPSAAKSSQTVCAEIARTNVVGPRLRPVDDPGGLSPYAAAGAKRTTEHRLLAHGLTDGELSLLQEWTIALQVANRSQNTIRSYMEAARQLAGFLAADGRQRELDGAETSDLQAFILDQLESCSATTAGIRYRNLQQFFRWLEEEGIREDNPMARMKHPKGVLKEIPVIPDEELRRLLATCAGPSIDHKRDEAILRVLIDCGLRRDELAQMRCTDLDFQYATIRVHGKGRKDRTVSYGNKTAQALSRYNRLRSKDSRAALEAFWVGGRGLGLTADGVRQMLERRCEAAGLRYIKPHAFRHTAAHVWFLSGRSESDAMRYFGWSSPQMCQLYAASAGTERALAAHRSLAPGDRV